MGLLDLFKNNKKEIKTIDYMDNQQVKESIKNQSIELIKNDNNKIEANSKIEIQFKYLEKVENRGLQSLYIVKVDDKPFYFQIEDDKILLLSEEASKFFDFEDDDE